MNGSQEILQEYLVKLGYQTDLISLRKFEDGLGKTGKSIFKIGAAVTGVVAAIEASTMAFAYSMRKMYFESELSGSTVKNLKAMAYAGKQVGISGDSMSSAIHGMAQAMRLNPGLQGLVESFGIKVTGRDISDVMNDFVGATRSMPEFVGAQFAGMFGMDPDTYHQYITHFDEINAKRQESLRLQKEMGLDYDKQKATILEYTSTLDKLQARFDVLSAAMLTRYLPAFKSLSKTADETMQWWTNWANGKQSMPEVTTKNVLGFIGEKTGISEAMQSTRDKFEKKHGPNQLKKNSSPVKPAPKPTQLFNQLETEYKLPSGLLDSDWLQESGRGKYMKSPAGAEGHFQFMPKTAKQYGLKNPNDLQESAAAAAKMYSYLLKKYKGNLENALTAYNWGEGNMDAYLKTGKGAKGQMMPDEAKNYASSVINNMRLGVDNSAQGKSIVVAPQTTIHITGGDAPKTAALVADAQTRVAGDIVRDMRGVIQ